MLPGETGRAATFVSIDKIGTCTTVLTATCGTLINIELA